MIDLFAAKLNGFLKHAVQSKTIFFGFSAKKFLKLITLLNLKLMVYL
jgi:hypothetical protein